MRTFQKQRIGGRFDSEFRHGYMPVLDHASAAPFRVVLLAKCLRSASHARHEKRLKTPPQSQNPPNYKNEARILEAVACMAGMAETVIARVVTRYSVDMMYFTCVALSVRQISAALYLSLGVSSLRSGRHGTSFGSWRSRVSNDSRS